jgi:hypothetical protein
MHHSLLGIAAIAMAAAAAPASAADAASTTYLVSLTIQDRGVLIAAPKLRVEAGKPSSVSFEREGKRYMLRFTPTPAEGSTVLFSANLEVRAADGSRTSADPRLPLQLGQRGMFTLGDEGPADTVSVYVQIDAVAG